MKLPRSFYLRHPVHQVATDLLGKVLYTFIDKKVASGMIVETEAYSFSERGCHAYGNLRTARTEVMFKPGGIAYVYLCYGIHHLFNVVTNGAEVAEAVLIRAIEPLEGKPAMLRRCNASSINKLTAGPAKLTRALGIDKNCNGKNLLGNKIWLADCGIKIATKSVKATTRVGIDYAGDDAMLPWRFLINDNPWISRS